jgi:Raf kinase inhibitor-like YbhB/YbcL family protein
MAVIVVDPDSPEGTFDHWLIWNISPDEMILENSAPGTEGKNSFGNIEYQGPCPNQGKVHRYLFKVYALSTFLDLLPGTHRKTLEEAMKDHIIGGGEITGMYSRSIAFK